jgi:hypothetical protein
MNNPICPYCNKTSTFYESSSQFYRGRNYGPVYACEDCDSLVGCHPGTTQPLGVPANKALRELRQNAHRAFDRLWRGGESVMKRSDAYRWLALNMGLLSKQCHIGMFGEDQCCKVIELVKQRTATESEAK